MGLEKLAAAALSPRLCQTLLGRKGAQSASSLGFMSICSVHMNACHACITSMPGAHTGHQGHWTETGVTDDCELPRARGKQPPVYEERPALRPRPL